MGLNDRLNGLNQGVAYKAPVLVATTENITLSGEQTIDGVAVLADSRVAVILQSDGTENGIYIVSSGTWTRTKDFDGARDVTEGTVFLVLYGTVNAGNFYRLTTTDEPVDFGSSDITFSLQATMAVNAAKNNYAATIAPVVTNDSSQGYSVGSVWVDTTNDVGYICYDVTVGAAVWVQFINLGENNTFLGNNTFSGSSTFSGANVFSGLNLFSNVSTFTNDIISVGAQISEAIGASVASAAALPIGKDGNYYEVTGIANITSIVSTGNVGTKITLKFSGSLILENHATNLILLGGENITTQAGDVAELIEYAAGDYRMVGYSKSSGQSIIPNGLILLSTATASSSASVEFISLIDNTYEEYEIRISGLTFSFDGTSLRVRFSSDGGATYDAGASDYAYQHTRLDTSNNINTGDTSISLCSSIGSDADTSCNVTIRLNNPSGSGYTSLSHAYNHQELPSGLGVYRHGSGGGSRRAASVIDAIEFSASSGTLLTGNFRLYGVKK